MATSSTIIGLHCGDKVRLRYDEKHEGTVLALVMDKVRVQWHGTTWISDEEPADLKLLSRRGWGNHPPRAF